MGIGDSITKGIVEIIRGVKDVGLEVENMVKDLIVGAFHLLEVGHPGLGIGIDGEWLALKEPQVAHEYDAVLRQEEIDVVGCVPGRHLH